ncbi:MAG TPA: hypothetical protein VF029_06750 [Actinomycetota bacterium]
MRVELRSLAAILALLAVALGCTDAPERDLPDVVIGSTTESPAASPPASPAPEVPTDVGRLAVLDDLGNLLTLGPDGSDTIVLAEAVQGETLVQQPTWSPDGKRLAWVQLEASESGVAASLVTATAEGGRPTRAPTSGAPFYLSWDPTSSRIAYLGPSPTSEIELGIVEVASGGDEATPLDAGSPFYLSWGPSGEQLLVHVGSERLERLDLDGAPSTVDGRPGTFNAPVWTPDGGSFVYASRSGERQRLVVHDLGEERGRELVRFDGGIRFVVSPEGTRVAFQVVDGSAGVGALSVVDRETGTIERVAEGPAPAFFWSPEGGRLLYLYADPDAERLWLRWGIWDGSTTFSTPRFYPTPVFGRDYLQFFEQYAQSMSLWAPDGTAFAYAGTSESGEQGIWVQPARSGAEPVLVADGVFAAWSPT